LIIVGLDISTSITAYSVMDTELPLGQRLLKSDSIHLSKIKDSYVKSCKVREELLNLNKTFKIDRVVVEESLQSFRMGLSSAKTLSVLTRFNGVVSFLAQDIFKVSCERINVNSARKKLSIKIDKKSEIPSKEQVRNWVMNHDDFQNFLWPTKTLKSGPRKGQTIYDPSCLDIADSAVMSLCVM
jgi:hypothetical protein